MRNYDIMKEIIMGKEGVPLNILESLVYGFVAGISEIMPISSKAHRYIIGNLLGAQQYDPILNALVTISVLIAVLSGISGILEQLRRSGRSRIHTRGSYTQNAGLLRFFKNAILPMLVVYFILYYWTDASTSYLTIAVCLLINGIALFIPGRMIQGNKTAVHMSLLDSLLAGISGALSALPGFSGTGMMTSVLVVRGTQRQRAFQWSLVLLLPLMAASVFTDVLTLFALGGHIVFATNFFGYIFAIVGGYLGGYLGVFLMRTMIARSDFTGFAYYCWGASMFAFLLYLIVV